MLHELLSRNFDLSRKDAVLQWYLDAAQHGRRFEWDTRPLEDDGDEGATATDSASDIAIAPDATATGKSVGGAHKKRGVSRWGAFDGVDNDAETVALMRAALRKVGGGGNATAQSSSKSESKSKSKVDNAAPTAVRARGDRSGSQSASAENSATRGRIVAAL